LATDNNLATSNDDVSYSSANNIYQGARLLKRSLDSTVDQESVIGGLRHRRLRKKLHPTKLNKFPTIFQSKGTHKKNLRPSKRFRMLDPDEFQEMLNSLSQQTPDEQPKGFNSMDTIAGMQLESKFIYNY
jgi:hypothetical protein